MSFYANLHDELRRRLDDASPEALDAVCDLFRTARDGRRKVIVAGNGGSAAIASHVSVDLTKTVGVRAINFNEADLITCFANDYGYEHWLAKAIERYADPGDVVVLISSSGRSPNILNGARQAKAAGQAVVTLSGFDADNPLRALGDLNLWVNSRTYNLIETAHQMWLLATLERLGDGGGH